MGFERVGEDLYPLFEREIVVGELLGKDKLPPLCKLPHQVHISIDIALVGVVVLQI